MLITATVILVGLSADVRRQSFIESYVDDNITYQNEYVQKDVAYSNDFYLDINSESKKSDLLNEIEREFVNKNVKKNTIDIIRHLSALYLINFDLNNLYQSAYGTAVLEFIKDDSNFTIEVGEESFGYFGEIDGDYITINEVILIPLNIDEREIVYGNLNNDFVDFYYSI